MTPQQLSRSIHLPRGPLSALMLAILGCLLSPAWALATEEFDLNLPLWSITPFVLLLLGVAILPLVAGHWWHKNRNKALVSALLGIPTTAYLFYVHFVQGQPTLLVFEEKMFEYAAFLALLGSLYVVSGGIMLRGDLKASPTINTAIFGLGAVLANLIGTTGASMLLIRPVLRINHHRTLRGHVPIFFIFCVSNTGGLLTPLGDPPLFLGFLNGIPFAWTLTLWPQWLVVNALVLIVFFVFDSLAFRKAPPAIRPQSKPLEPRRIEGSINFLFLAGVIGAVLLQGTMKAGFSRDIIPASIMIAMGLLSLKLTPTSLRQANSFTWEPIIEVAVLFLGIFVTMVPALAILGRRGGGLGLTEPWHYFWLTGGLSAFLDNAPTYLTFASIAAGKQTFDWLTLPNAELQHPQILQAISCGAVFMGALTYIGNGPNFMVKAIADESGTKTPSFFGYLGYSCLVLLPIFCVVHFVFF